jgi:DNA-binding transcriptional ArsR family regulator
MPGQKANLILHPIRLRILTAISSYHMNTKEIADLMPDIPQTTLYRHINALLEGGLLKIVEEKQIRGTIERTYALTAPPSLRSEDLRDMSREECEQVFNLYLSSLMTDAQQYLDSKPANGKINPIDDGVEISKVQFFLDEEEFRQMSSKILELVLAATSNQPEPGRVRRMFSCVFIPLGNNPGSS